MRSTLTTALLAILAVAALFPKQGTAATWRVEQDGSGDWFGIQAAVEAAANGDTILVGPGQYSSLHPVPYSDVIAYWDDSKELFLFGAGVEKT